jgi:hypothetical protein
MNLESVQNYFKEQISLGNYDEVQVTGYTMFTRWVSLQVNERPFVIRVNEFNVTQEGDIFENYLQLGEFSNQQKERIYARYKDRINEDSKRDNI